jgi:hypothetical protein
MDRTVHTSSNLVIGERVSLIRVVPWNGIHWSLFASASAPLEIKSIRPNVHVVCLSRKMLAPEVYPNSVTASQVDQDLNFQLDRGAT